MLKKKIGLIKTVDVFAEEPAKRGKKADTNKKPVVKKEYVKTIPDKEMQIAEGVKLVFSVAQTSQDSPAHVDIRTWVESENYTGPTKKGINFDIENLEELISTLQEISSECEEVGV